MPRGAVLRGRKAVHWWSDELAALRRSSCMARRRYQRAGRRDDAEGRAREREAYSAARKELRRAIRLAQIESWKKLCLLVDEDPWGLPYRVVMKKLGAKTRLPEGQELDIANALFPSRPEVTWSVGAAPAHPDLQAELFSMDELVLMASKLPGGKAPGPDYIPNEVAPQKSEAVVLTNKWAYRDPVFILGGQQISVKPSMRYLGVQLDKRLNFGDHIRLVTAAARRAVSALGRLRPNVQGPSACKRWLLMSVAHSKLLYASPVRALAAARAARNRVALSQAQRGAAIRVARCYRTVSDMAALVLARMPPAHLLADERRRIEERKQEPTTVAVIRRQEREATLREWPVIWDHTEKAAWTRRMIPDIKRWVYQPNQEAITFHMAQAMTGHGCFQHYLWKRRRAGDPHCMHCDEPDDTVEHTLFNCPFWAEDRREMEQCVGRPLQPNDVPNIILGPEQELLLDDASRRRRIEAMAEGLRLAFGRIVEAILGRKEDTERVRQARLLFVGRRPIT
ncbi:hypothetical protein QTP88_025653 [Uroleucon formosanum]